MTLAVLLPFAVQFGHSFTHKNHHAACNSSQDLHIDTHESNCKFLHFKIKQNGVVFNNYQTHIKIVYNTSKTTVSKQNFTTYYIPNSASRAPPVLL